MEYLTFIYCREYHEGLEYTQLEPLFSCVLIDATTALGIRFNSAGDEGSFLPVGLSPLNINFYC